MENGKRRNNSRPSFSILHSPFSIFLSFVSWCLGGLILAYSLAVFSRSIRRSVRSKSRCSTKPTMWRLSWLSTTVNTATWWLVNTSSRLASGRSIGTPVWSAEGDYLTVARDADGSGPHMLVKVMADGSSPLLELGPGESPCAVAGQPVSPDVALEAETPLEHLRRADLLLVSGGWS